MVRPPRRGACGETFTPAERTHNTRVQICIFKAMWGCGVTGEGAQGAESGLLGVCGAGSPPPTAGLLSGVTDFVLRLLCLGSLQEGGASQPGAPGNPGPSRRPSRGHDALSRRLPGAGGSLSSSCTRRPRLGPAALGPAPRVASRSAGSARSAGGGGLPGGREQPEPQSRLGSAPPGQPRWALGSWAPRGWELVAAGGPVSARVRMRLFGAGAGAGSATRPPPETPPHPSPSSLPRAPQRQAPPALAQQRRPSPIPGVPRGPGCPPKLVSKDPSALSSAQTLGSKSVPFYWNLVRRVGSLVWICVRGGPFPQ